MWKFERQHLNTPTWNKHFRGGKPFFDANEISFRISHSLRPGGVRGARGAFKGIIIVEEVRKEEDVCWKTDFIWHMMMFFMPCATLGSTHTHEHFCFNLMNVSSVFITKNSRSHMPLSPPPQSTRLNVKEIFFLLLLLVVLTLLCHTHDMQWFVDVHWFSSSSFALALISAYYGILTFHRDMMIFFRVVR